MAAILFTAGLSATNRVKIVSERPKPAVIKLVASVAGGPAIRFTLDDFLKKTVSTSEGGAWLVTTASGGRNLAKGEPDLPVFATSVIIPGDAKMQVRVLSARYEEFRDVLVAPSKGKVMRQTDPESLPYAFGPVYKEDAFYPGNLAILREPYVLRDFRGQAIVFRPFQYNPVSRTLRVFYEIVIRVEEAGRSSVNSLPGDGFPEVKNNSFDPVYRRHFLNYNSFGSRQKIVEEEGNLLILTDGRFISQLQPLVSWRQQCGRQVEVVEVSTIGEAQEIRQFVSDYFYDKGLTYLLLVGDGAQVPPLLVGGNYSDNAYAFVAGKDHYPDFFVGRFSAEDTSQVKTMVKRTIDYEKYPLADAAWYSHATGIASTLGPGDDGESDFQHLRNIASNKLLTFTYTGAGEFFDGSQGGNDSNGNPTAGMLIQAINDGTGIINYTGHGSIPGWTTSGFSISSINALENTGKLPFIFSAACNNGDFVNKTCFAEAWLRATYNGKPAGAVAVLMSTGDQSWSPPMHGQDEMNAILSESFQDNIKRTFAGIAMNGCLSMMDVYGPAGEEVTDTWTVFGDPALSIRTVVPTTMKVSHPPALQCSDSTMNFSCDAEGAVATLSLEGRILGKTVTSNGNGQLSFSLPCRTAFVDFVVTAFNYRPYFTTIELRPDTGTGEGDKSGIGLTASPNPFSRTVNIAVRVETEAEFLLEIRNSSGQVVKTFSGEKKNGGSFLFEWKAVGQESGIYFCTLKSQRKIITEKLVLLR